MWNTGHLVKERLGGADMLVALVLMVIPLILWVFMKSGQKLSVLPRDGLGKSSVALDIAFILFFFPIVLLTGALTIIPVAACVTGLISMTKSKERCVLVFVSTTLGLGLLLGAVGYWFI
jgi:uncharacterized Tic20 family protein